MILNLCEGIRLSGDIDVLCMYSFYSSDGTATTVTTSLVMDTVRTLSM